MGKERKIRIWSSKSSITDYSLIPPGMVLISSKNFLEIDRREGEKIEKSTWRVIYKLQTKEPSNIIIFF